MKYSCANQRERVEFTNKVSREIIHLERVFKNLISEEKNSDDKKVEIFFIIVTLVKFLVFFFFIQKFDLSVLDSMNKIIKNDDIGFIGVDIGVSFPFFFQFYCLK